MKRFTVNRFRNVNRLGGNLVGIDSFAAIGFRSLLGFVGFVLFDLATAKAGAFRTIAFERRGATIRAEKLSAQSAKGSGLGFVLLGVHSSSFLLHSVHAINPKRQTIYGH